MRSEHKFGKEFFKGLKFEEIHITTNKNWAAALVLFSDENGKFKAFGIYPNSDYVHLIDTEDNSHYADLESGKLLPKPPRPWEK